MIDIIKPLKHTLDKYGIIIESYQPFYQDVTFLVKLFYSGYEAEFYYICPFSNTRAFPCISLNDKESYHISAIALLFMQKIVKDHMYMSSVYWHPIDGQMTVYYTTSFEELESNRSQEFLKIMGDFFSYKNCGFSKNGIIEISYNDTKFNF